MRALVAAVFLSVAVWGQTPTAITAVDIVSMRHVAFVLPSPDGSRVAFGRTEPRLAGEDPGPDHLHLWMMDARGGPGSERRLMGGRRRVARPAFSPDGETITFIDRPEGSPHREVMGLPLAGGEPSPLTRTPHGVLDYQWSPDGRFLGFLSPRPASKERDAARRMGFRQTVVDEDWEGVDLWVWTRSSGESKRLTSAGCVFGFQWSPNSQRLAFSLAPRNLVDDSYMKLQLHGADPTTGSVKPLVKTPGKLGAFAWSKSGTRLAFISAVDARDPHAGMLHVLEPDGSVLRLDDGFVGMFHTVEWEDDRILRGTLSRGVETFRYRSWPGMYLHSESTGVSCRDVVMASDSVGYGVGSTGAFGNEVFRFETGRPPARMTDSNPWIASRKLGKQTIERITARDGTVIEGILIHPADGHPTEKRPLVIVAHGGPEAHFSNEWLTNYSQWGQVLANRGVYVWHPNYRASTGYGVAFAKADHGDPMGREFEDHLDAIGAFAKRGWVDPDRVGIGGGSYGGYTAAWAATRHSDFFAAAVSFVPFVDIRTKWLTSDIPTEFYLVHYEEKWPWEQEEFLRERSPLTYATRCRTPLLLLGGTSDPRVHPSQPHMLYRAVQAGTSTPVRYVQYPGEGHGNRTNVYRYDYLARTLQWFEHYLLRDGAARTDPPPPPDLDYKAWEEAGRSQ